MRALFLVVTLAACWQGKESPPPEHPPSPTPPAEPPRAAPEEALRIDGLEPAQGDINGGTYVLLKGNRFLADGPRRVEVFFGKSAAYRKATVVRFASDKQLIIQAPGGKPGEVVDVLVVFEPGGQLTLPHAFTFVNKPPPPP